MEAVTSISYGLPRFDATHLRITQVFRGIGLRRLRRRCPLDGTALTTIDVEARTRTDERAYERMRTVRITSTLFKPVARVVGVTVLRHVLQVTLNDVGEAPMLVPPITV